MKDLKQLFDGAGITPDELNEFLQAKKQKEEKKWTKLLETDSKGNYLLSPQNYMIFFNNHPDFKGKLRFNIIKNKRVFDDKEVSDFDMDIFYNRTYEFFKKGNEKNFKTALSQIFEENKYNPIKDYLDSLRWDGTPRMETLFIDWLGAEDNELNRQMTKKWLMAAIKRVIQPGCQFDNMIILQCAEGGGGKTTLVKRLGLNFGDGVENYYNELLGSSIDNEKFTVNTMDESWIISFDELDGLNKKEVNNIKTFLSRTQEKIRMAYDRFVTTHSRHCVFIGSTNENNFLRDYTG